MQYFYVSLRKTSQLNYVRMLSYEEYLFHTYRKCSFRFIWTMNFVCHSIICRIHIQFTQLPKEKPLYLLFSMIQDPTNDCSHLLQSCLVFLKSVTVPPTLTFSLSKHRHYFKNPGQFFYRKVLQSGFVCFFMIRLGLNRVARIPYS